MSRRLLTLALSLGLAGTLVMSTAGIVLAVACTTTCYVDPAGNDANDGDTPATAKKTIQAAVNQVAIGGTVNVAAGTYVENVTLAKDITINGQQVGVDARGRVATESILAPAAGIGLQLQAGSAGATLDGFTISGGASGIESTGGPLTGLSILNTRIIGFTSAGIRLNHTGADITLTQNVVDGTSKTGPDGLVDLDTDAFDGFWFVDNNVVNGTSVGEAGLFSDGDRNVGMSTRAPRLDGNLFQGNTNGVNLGESSWEFASITGNTFRMNTFAGLTGGPADSTITMNTFDGNGRVGLELTSFSSGVATDGAQRNTITKNTVTANGLTSAGQGIRLAQDQAPGTIATNEVHRNAISGNQAGLTYTGAEMIDAECNYWGALSGPGPVGPGTGDTVSANVDFTPWLTTNDLDGGCSVDLAISKTHTGSFTQGQAGATYTITVTNNGTGATAGTVTVTDAVPFGLTPTGISGMGWTCTQPGGPCTRTDPLAAGGASYPPLTLTVSANPDAPASVTNSVTVSATGDPNPADNTANDQTSINQITPPPPGTTPPGGATKLGFLTLPGTPAPGVAFANPIRVAIQNAAGNTVTTSSATIALSIGANPGGGTLTCASGLSAPTVQGVATFQGCSIDKAGTGYTLVATASNIVPATPLAPSTTPPFNVQAPGTVVTTLKVTASTPVITWGGAVVLTVELGPNGGNRQVRLEGARDPVNPTNFVLISTLTTDASGRATLNYTPVTNLFYRAAFTGAADLPAAISELTRVVVRQVNLLRPTNAGKVKTVNAGTLVSFKSTVRPARPELAPASVRFTIFERRAGTWVNVLTQTLVVDAAGVAILNVTFNAAGAFYVRSMANPTPYNANSVNSPIERYNVR